MIDNNIIYVQSYNNYFFYHLNYDIENLKKLENCQIESYFKPKDN